MLFAKLDLSTLLSSQPPVLATLGAFGLAFGCALSVALVTYRKFSANSVPIRVLGTIASGGVVFQIVHFLEHALQLAFWWALPKTEKPWLSPWADSTADGLRLICSIVDAASKPTVGVEALHLTGNMIFLGALAAWQQLLAQQAKARKSNTKTKIVSLNRAEKLQALHVAEHVLLTSTLLVFGKALGVSTVFGLIDGAALTAIRVWFHFSINLVATTLAIKAIFEYRSAMSNLRPVIAAEKEGNQPELEVV